MRYNDIADATVSEAAAGGLTLTDVSYCLDNRISNGQFYFTEPFDNLSTLSPLQERWIGSLEENVGYVPVTEYFHLSLGKVYELAVQETHPCLVRSSG